MSTPLDKKWSRFVRSLPDESSDILRLLRDAVELEFGPVKRVAEVQSSRLGQLFQPSPGLSALSP